MKKITLIAVSAFFALTASAQTFTATYGFDLVVSGASGTTDPTPAPTATGATFSSFTAVGTPANPNATGRFSFTDWALGAVASSDVYTDHTGTINTAEYYEVTVTPTSPYTLSLSDLTFRIQRSGTGIRTYAVRSSVDGFTTNLPALINPTNANLSVQAGDVFYWNTDALTTPGQDGSTITLGGTSFTNLTSPVTFRFYGWNAEAITGTFSIDNVIINGTATAPAALNANFSADSVCFGNATTFTDLSSGPNTITSWAWDFGTATGTSTVQNPTYTYASSGAFLVTLTVTDNMLNTDTYSDSVYVYTKPTAGFTSAPTTVCGGIVQFNDGSSITSGTITSYSWNFGDSVNNISSLQNPTHIFSNQGTYTVTETVTSDMGCMDTATATINNFIVDASLSTVITGDSVAFTGNATGGSPAYMYSLDFGDGSPLATTANASHEYVDGTYTACLTVTDMNGCSDSSCTTFTILTTGIGSYSNISYVEIMPNPSSNGVFTVACGNATVTVYNLIGEIVISKQVTEGKHNIDLSNESNGSYFISIATEKNVTTKKIIINK
jgi:PKD repeat protein